MEETLSHIVRGCKLARELESNIPNLAKQPRMLAKSCDEIMKIFGTAKERLNAQDDHSAYPYMFAQASGMETSGEMQEWLKTSYLQALQAQYGLTESKVGGIEPVTLSGHPGFELGGRDREGSARSTGSGGEFQAMEGSDSGNSNSQRLRRRKDDIRKRKETVAAPRIGNTDIPPDDNFTWRKYGQKEILGSKYPR
ncbi:WRKY transcription factor 55 [Vitis vinifera]|nr:WRKY transcription factor 55 [Vitis vinifera]